MRKLLIPALFCGAVFFSAPAWAEGPGYEAPPPFMGVYKGPPVHGYGHHYGQPHHGWRHRPHHYGSPVPQQHHYGRRNRNYYWQ
jgi:hypothetical protein